MTGYERMKATLERKPVDRISYRVSPWGDTCQRWIKEGHLKEGEDIVSHFNFDYRDAGWFNSVADLDFEPIVIEEKTTTRKVLFVDINDTKREIGETVGITIVHQRKGNNSQWEDGIMPAIKRNNSTRFGIFAGMKGNNSE